MTFDEAHAYLLALPRFADQGAAAIRPGLAHMEALMEALGQPHTAFESIHIAGTNGKGSTASCLAAIATASGRRVGLHTSPHLFHVGERLRIDGKPAPDGWLADAVGRYRPVFDAIQPSFFEVTTALSFLYFAEQHVDVAVIEVGLGGRLDATNILLPCLSLITNIDLEHTDLLGETLEAIAREKAGIIKPGVPVLTAATQPEVTAVIRAIAEAHRAPYHALQDEVQALYTAASIKGLRLHARTPLRSYPALEVSLPGIHQKTNALLALRAAEMVFEDLRQDAAPIYAGLRAVHRFAGLRGRLDVLHQHPLVVADVAHNPQGLRAALAFVYQQGRLRQGRLYVMLGVLRDKDVAGMAQALADVHAKTYTVQGDTARAIPADELAVRLQTHGVPALPVHTLRNGWNRFHREATTRDVLLITGSHQVVSQLSTLPSAALTPPAQR